MANPRNMNDGLKRESSRTGDRRTTERQHSKLSEFFERGKATTLLDRARDALWEKKPPRNQIPIPGVDDHLDILIKQITLDEDYWHFLRERKAHAPLVAAASVTHGVKVVITESHLNRTATSGCVSRLVVHLVVVSNQRRSSRTSLVAMFSLHST